MTGDPSEPPASFRFCVGLAHPAVNQLGDRTLSMKRQLIVDLPFSLDAVNIGLAPGARTHLV